MKGCAAELKVSDWQMKAWTSWVCDTVVKGRRGIAVDIKDSACRFQMDSGSHSVEDWAAIGFKFVFFPTSPSICRQVYRQPSR